MKKLILTFALLFATSANASIVTFTDALAFENATNDSTVIDDYNNVSSMFFTDGVVVDRGLYELVQANSVTGFFENNGVGGTGAIVIGFSNGGASLSFNLDNAFGAFYFNVSFAANAQSYVFSANGESTTFDVNGNDFIGFTLSQATNSFTITDIDNNGNGNFDNFGVANSAMIGVPSPALFVMFLAGTMFLGFRSKRQ